MKYFLYFLCLFSFNNLLSQDLIWTKSFNGAGDNRIFKSVIDQQNNLYLIGYFTGTMSVGSTNYTSGGGYDAYVSKYNANGDLIWFHLISSNLDDLTDGITLSNDGSQIFIAGGFYGNTCDFGNGITLDNSDTGTSDAFVVSLNTSDGSVNTLKRFAYGPGSQRPQAIKVDKNNNIVIVGYIHGNANITNFSNTETVTCSGPQNYYILQLNSNLDLNWVKNYTGNDGNNKLFSLDVDDNGYYIAGTNRFDLNLDVDTLSSQGGTSDMFLYKTDFSGNGQWIRSIKGSGNDVSVYSTCDQQGYIYISGYYTSSDLKVDSTATLQSIRTVPNKGSNDIFFAKYTTDGTLQWFDIAGSTGDDRLTRLSTDGENIVIAGQYGGSMTFNNETITPAGGTDALGIVHDKNDNLLYAISAGGTGNDVAQSCVIDNDGNYIFTGNFYSDTIKFDTDPSHNLINSVSNKSTRDVFIAKYKSRSITLNPVAVKCAGTFTGSIAANPKGAWIGDKTYLWRKDGDPAFTANTSRITNLSAGTYTCTVSIGSISETASTTLTDPTPLTVSLQSKTDAKCYKSADGNIQVLATGGTGTKKYVWSGTGNGIIASNLSQSTLTSGIYNVTVTDDNDCTSKLENISITEPTKITLTATSQFTGPDGSIYLTVNGGAPDYTYNWSSGAITMNITNVPGNYSVMVTDQIGCKADSSFLIVDETKIYATITQKKDVSCFNGNDGAIEITLHNASSNLTYSWSNSANTSSINNIAAGTYSVTVTDNDVSKSFTLSGIVIKQPAALSVITTKVNPACAGSANGIVDSNVSGGTLPYIYQWKKDGNSIPDNMEVISDKRQGVYEVSILDANNCPASISTTLTDPAAISLNAAIVTPVSCIQTKNDGIIALNITGGTGASTFLWSNGLTSANISLLSPGSYTCTITDANKCSITTTQTVGQPSPITALFNNTNVSCFGGSTGSIDMTPSGGNAGGYTYVWNNSSTNEDLTSLALGTYSVKIKDSKNCEKTLTTTITEPAALNITASLIQNVTCNGAANGNISLNTTGGTTPYNWVWSDSQTGPVATNLVAGTYSVTVTDGNSCSQNTSFQVSEPTALVISEIATSHNDVTCNGDVSGALEVTASGSSGTYQYSVDGTTWHSSGLFSNLPSGNYPVMVRDQSVTSCTKTFSPAIVITQPTAISVTSSSSNNATCNGLNNGSINVQAIGGTGTLAYKLLINGTPSTNISGASTGNFIGLAPASYTVEVTNANNCGPVTSSVFNITEPSAIAISSATKTDITCNGLTNGAIDVQATGGTVALAYNLLLDGTSTGNNTGASSGKFTDLAADISYTIEVTDINNCPSAISSSLTILEPEAIVITSEIVNKTTGIGLTDGSVEVVSTGGKGILNYFLDNGTPFTSGLFEGLAKGTYLISVTDENSCGPVLCNPLIVDDPTAIDLIKFGIVKVYPNPVSEKVFIEVRNLELKSLKIELKNISGQATISQKFENVEKGFIATIDLFQLPKGVYIVIINDIVTKDKLIVL